MTDTDVTNDEVLINAPLVLDPVIDREMASDVAAIADGEMRGCRLLVVRRAIQGIGVDDTRGGLVKFGVSFQPTDGLRFAWAQLVFALSEPEDALFVDVAPATTMDRPVKFTVDVSGKLGASFETAGAPGVKAGVSSKTSTEFEVYHCAVHGTGAGTSKGRWEFAENPQRKDGLGREHTLLMTIRGTGKITGNVSVYSKLVRPGLLGEVDAATYLLLGAHEHYAPLTLRIPSA